MAKGKAGRPKGKPEPDKLSRDEGIERTAGLLRDAVAIGRDVTGPQVMQALAVSKPTALSYLRAARARVATEAARGAVEVVGELVGGPVQLEHPKPAHMTVDQEQAITTGVNMMAILSRVARDLDGVAKTITVDLEQVRWWTMGGPDGSPMPGHCLKCNAAIADRIARGIPTPLVGKLDVQGLGRLYDSLIKSLRALTEVAGEQNDILEQFYNYRALQQFMQHTEQAIRELAPDQAAAIASRIRELGQGAG